jgi:imidazolonepropionase-like amidohydrolase
VAEADAHGLPVTAHVASPQAAGRAAKTGVRVLAHTPWTGPLDDDLVALLAARVRLISTIDIHGWGADTAERRTAITNLRRFHTAGGTIHYGTDLGNGPLIEGVNGRELTALTEAGLSGMDILTAITRSPLAPGAPADLTTIPRDPLTDPCALVDATALIKAGVPVELDPARTPVSDGRAKSG